jgi:hypothetical protein
VAFAAQMAELETHLIEHQIPFAPGHLKQAKYEVFKATRREKSSIEAFFACNNN